MPLDGVPEQLPVLYRDEHLVAVAKPSGLLVHRTGIDAHETRFAVQIVRDQIGQRVFPIHRLDKGASGVLLFALTPDACATVRAELDEQRIHKRYVAIVRGVPPDSGTIDSPLAAVQDFRIKPSTLPVAAVTDYRRLAEAELPVSVDRYPTTRYALVELAPHGGRRHQLRRHMKHISHPIIGDTTYGKSLHNRFFEQRFDNHRLLLACVGMGFSHPVSKTPTTIVASPSDDFARVAALLGWKDALEQLV